MEASKCMKRLLKKRLIFQELLQDLKTLAPSVSEAKLQLILSAAFAILSKEGAAQGLPDFPIDNLSAAALILVNQKPTPKTS